MVKRKMTMNRLFVRLTLGAWIAGCAGCSVFTSEKPAAPAAPVPPAKEPRVVRVNPVRKPLCGVAQAGVAADEGCPAGRFRETLKRAGEEMEAVATGRAAPAKGIVAEAIRGGSQAMDFGSERWGGLAEGTTNVLGAAAAYGEDVRRFRLQLRKGRRWDEIPPAGDDCVYLVTMDEKRTQLNIVAANFRNAEAEFELRMPAGWRILPQAYRVYECPERHLDSYEVSGAPSFTRRYGYETFRPQKDERVIAGPVILRIPPNSVTSVRVPVELSSIEWAARDIIEEALLLEKQGAVQFCAFRDGKCIVNVAGGTLSTNACAAPATTTSLFPIFSTEKPMLATAVHRAVEQGKMDYDKPLSTWWPEFGCNGKEKLTLRETLAYRTGVNGGRPKGIVEERDYGDWEKLVACQAADAPEIEPGTRQRYMPRAFAWMLGHPLEVAMGKPLKEVLDEQVLIPAGISDEFYFVCDEDIFPRIATVYHGRYTEVMNSGWARKAMLPSSFAVASAHGIAKFYNRLCGFDGQPPLLRPETLEEALKVCRHPSDPIPSLQYQKKWFVMLFGMGYGLWGDMDDLGGVFGHGGSGGSEGLCDRRKKLTVGFTCNFEDPYTYRTLRRKLYELVGMRMRYSDRDEFDIQAVQMDSQRR